jgi:predicted Zn-dependent protease
MTRTYLHDCLKNDRLVRWPDSAMPLKVYIAPFTWYEKSKQRESTVYRQMVLDALEVWQKASQGKVKFQLVTALNQSQIDIKWRRVDRKSLGHCTYEIDPQGRLFTAEIQIGISDGMLHAQYQDASEVKHTILHEIGHALGLLGHSDGPEDIMFVPHQFGVFELSSRDQETLSWLYKLPLGFDFKPMGKKYGLEEPYTLHTVIEAIDQKQKGIEPEVIQATLNPPRPKPISPQKNTLDLDQQHQVLSHMGQFYIQTQKIAPPKETLKILHKRAELRPFFRKKPEP